MVEQAGAARLRQELGADSEEAARRNLEFDAHAAAAGIDHVGHLGAPRLQLLHHRAHVLLIDVHDQRFVWLHRLSADFLEDHLRTGERELESFAAHVLRENREMQLAAATHFEAIRLIGVLDAEGDVLAQLALQAIVEVA